MNFKNALWGIIFIALGALFLLKNLDVIYFSWWDIWHLWPIMLVLIGISVLPIKAMYKVILTIAAIAVAVVLLLSNPGWHRGWPFHIRWESSNDWESDKTEDKQVIYEEFDSITTEASLDFDAAAGEFTIRSTTPKLFNFNKDGNFGHYIYSIKDLDNRKEVKIDLDEQISSSIKLKNEVELKLNENPVWELSIDVGAAAIELDLRKFKVKDLNIDGGASAIEVILGDLHDMVTVDIDAGATSLLIKVPEDAACEVNTESVLSSKNLRGFNEVSAGTYISENFTESDKNIIINLDVAISSLTVKRY